jgi:S-adenosylmethionine:tRNA ribosyltransferase-isomerase
MDVKDFDYELPEALIAQTPLADRSSSRLMVVNRNDETLTHTNFTTVADYLTAGDVLVLNESKVIPARLFGTKVGTGASIECLLLKQTQADTWEVLLKPGKRVKIGTEISFGAGLLHARCCAKLDEGIYVIEFIYEGIFLEILEQLGTMPLPPYIHEQLADKDRYQTVYAQTPGSVAAPTAGLHFTPELLRTLREKGVIIASVTLHVGLGTFRPVGVETIEAHTMHSEYYEMSDESAQVLNEAKAAGRRIISVGTTSTRVLETVFAQNNGFVGASGWTNIFIYPGYQWQAVDGLLTNFHLPKSTLLMLVSSFASLPLMQAAYASAVEKEYRFFSFGDAMLLV